MAKFEPIVTTVDSLLKPELVFFGTGHISLRALTAVAKQFMIEAVVTKSPRGAHNSQSTTATQDWADEHGVDCYQASSKEELRQLFAGSNFRAQLGLVVDYGVIIPEEVIDYFPLGIVNSHFSLLPKHRGADPIRAAIVNRDELTGITAMKITPRLDDGPILAQSEIKLDQTETASELTAALLELQDNWLPQILTDYLRGDIKPEPQEESTATHTTKLAKADGDINWTESAATIEAKIRAYADWPKSRTTISDINVVVHTATVTDVKSVDKPGSTHINHKQLLVDTGDYQLELTQLQPAGKKPMDATSFINGYLQ
jgi:methionyl-tRNA formyltransferase